MLIHKDNRLWIFHNGKNTMVSNKKSQLTLYIIFGLVLLMMFFVLFYTLKPQMIKKTTNTGDFEMFMNVCLKNYAEYSLHKIGFAGGDLNSHTKKFNRQFTITSYALYQNDVYILSNEAIELQLANEMKNGVLKCISKFPNKNYEIDTGIIKTDVVIAKESVLFDIDSDITLSYDNIEKSYDKFLLKIPVKLDRALNIMKTVAEEYKENKWFNLYEYLSEQPFEVRILSYENDDILIYLIDKEELIRGQPYLFRFALS